MRRKEQMNSENMEIRAFNFEVRAQEDEEHGTFVEGTPIVYDSWTNLGWYDEMIDRGALADTDLRDVRFLVKRVRRKYELVIWLHRRTHITIGVIIKRWFRISFKRN
jgi:hypothetical protein